MRSSAVFFLAAVVTAQSWLQADAGADADDSWVVGEIAETATLIVDRISEAKKFLADLDDDQFDFQQWYEQQLDDFQADQDNVAYEDQEDADEDLEDFKQQLDAISTEFASEQGEDYANFVRDIIGEGIDHLHDQGQELLNRMQETANDINDLEEQEYDLYIQLGKISCVSNVGGNGFQFPLIEVGDNTDGWPTSVPVKPVDFTLDPIKPVDATIKTHSTCYLAALAEELNEYYKHYLKAGATTATHNKYLRKIQKAAKSYRDYVRKWQKLFHTFSDVEQKEEHERQEYDQYEFLLKGSQELQEFGMTGSDSLVLDDSLVSSQFND